MTDVKLGNLDSRRARAREKARNTRSATQDYVVAGEYQTLEEKKKVLERLGKPELIEVFKDWKPQIEKRRSAKGPPLDQRVAISVTSMEKDDLNREIERIKKIGGVSNLSEFIRGRATSSVDIIGWREKAETLLQGIDENSRNSRALKKKRAQLRAQMEDMQADDSYDEEDFYLAQKRLRQVIDRLDTLEVKAKKRAARLSGRMTTAESETIKWRANRLSLSVSDYLRFCLFSHEPGSEGDSHLSVEAKKRFYISIIDVAENGWGESPKIYQCKQCQHYRDDLDKARQRIRDLENFLPD